MKLEYPMFKNGRYCLKNEDFEQIADMILGKYLPDSLKQPRPTDIDYLIEECLYLDVIQVHITLGGSILGVMVFEDTPWTYFDATYSPVKSKLNEATMLIDLSLLGEENLPRARFTKAHEVSHWICHRAMHSQRKQAYEFRTTPFVACRDISIGSEESDHGKAKRLRTEQEWEEWQANRLAASLLMPKTTFTQTANLVMSSYGIKGRKLMLGYDVNVGRKVVSTVARLFMVSQRAAEIRMKELGLLVPPSIMH